MQIGFAVFSTGAFQVWAIPIYTFISRRIDRGLLGHTVFSLVAFEGH
jgi:hypothetical protein